MFKAQIAKDAALPARVSLRIPASSGGRSALAYAATEQGGLLNLKYERSDAGDFITLRFTAPERFIRVEFYDHFLKGTPERDYRYVWPGDLSVGRMRAVVQEPAASSGFSVEPKMDSAAGEDGLRYWSAALQGLERGKNFPVRLRYTKSDSRTSEEILKANAPAAQSGSPVLAPEPLPRTGSRSALLIGLGIGLPLLAAWGAYFGWRWRVRTVAKRPSGAAFCRQCGNRIEAADRFCSGCGTALA